MTSTESIIVGAVGIGLVAATSTPAFLTIGKSLFARRNDADDHHVDGLYADGDGVATEESQKAFSTLIPRCLALVGSITGLLLSVAAAVLATIHPHRALFMESWLTLASW
ncbi:hypothetical protein MMC30_000990, partial [Trapelia coarctata]|nr:hypothetical protein [Trapelia coarctata]